MEHKRITARDVLSKTVSFPSDEAQARLSHLVGLDGHIKGTNARPASDFRSADGGHLEQTPLQKPATRGRTRKGCSSLDHI